MTGWPVVAHQCRGAGNDGQKHRTKQHARNDERRLPWCDGGDDDGATQQKIEQCQRLPTFVAVQQFGPKPRRRHHRHTQQSVEHSDHEGRGGLLSQKRDDEGHVADVARAKAGIAQ